MTTTTSPPPPLLRTIPLCPAIGTYEVDSFLESPPDSIRTRLWKVRDSDDWSEVLAVSNAVLAKNQEIENCQGLSIRLLFSVDNANVNAIDDNVNIVLRYGSTLVSLQHEQFDLTWPASLSDCPERAWRRLTNSKSTKEWLFQCPKRCREAGWILLLQSPPSKAAPVLQKLLAMADPHEGVLLRDPTFLRACFEKNVFDNASGGVCPVPAPAILEDRGLVVQILQRFPSFLQLEDIPTDFFTDRDLFEATACGILHTLSDVDVLCLFSEILRNDAGLMLQTLLRLYGRCGFEGSASFVGRQLCDDKEFCLRVAEDMSTASERLESQVCLGPRRLLDLSHLSDRLQHDPAVVTAFCRLDGKNFTVAPEKLQHDSVVVYAICDALPSAIVRVPPCPARSELESSVPFVVRLLKETVQVDLPQSYFMGLPPFILESREVSLAAATAPHPSLVHRRWKKCVHFWCDAIRRVESDLGQCYGQIPLKMRHNPRILNAVVRHPDIDDLSFSQEFLSRSLFEALLRRVSDRESLRECVRYAKAVNNCWDPNLWHQIPQALWEDKELCGELLSWHPSLYGCLPNRRKSDPDVLAALLVANPENYPGWATLLGLIPFEVQLQNPDLVLRVLKGFADCTLALKFTSSWHVNRNELASDLWRNREVVLALFRCGMLCYASLLRPPVGVMEHFENDQELWLEVARLPFRSLFKTRCPASLRSDPQFMLRAVRANHQICLPCLTGDPPADFELILAASAASLEFVETVVSRVEATSSLDFGEAYASRDPDYEKKLYPALKVYLCREVRERAARYLSFSSFLSLQPSVGHPLGILNQAPATAQAHRSLLASYAGVPVDDEKRAEELSRLKCFCVALARRGL